MENIKLAFSVVFPLMVMMFVGYQLKKRGVIDKHSMNVMNKMIFKIFLPILLFINIINMEPEEALSQDNIKLLIMTILSVIGSVILGQIIFSRFIKNKQKCSVMIQGIFRSNLVLFGLPIAASIYGEDRTGIVSLLAACIVPLYNILAVIVLEAYRGGKVKFKNVFFGIVKNPMIIASALAVILFMLGIHIPDFFMSPLISMSKIATPLAFIVLGGTFQFNNLLKNIKYLFVVSLGKLVILPTIVFFVAYVLGFRGEAIIALIGTMASPAAVSSFTMAMEMDADGELAGQIVIITSIVSILTIFMWILLLKTLHII